MRLLCVAGGPTFGTDEVGTLTLTDLTLGGGYALGGTSGGGAGLGAGGAIFNIGTLNLVGVSIQYNTALGGSAYTGDGSGGAGMGENSPKGLRRGRIRGLVEHPEQRRSGRERGWRR